MAPKQERDFTPIIQLLEGILPEIDDALQYMEDNGAWLPLSDEFIKSLHNLKITSWAEYYLDPKKLKALTILCFYDEKELTHASAKPPKQKSYEVTKSHEIRSCNHAFDLSNPDFA